jgi:hypothetical protein
MILITWDSSSTLFAFSVTTNLSSAGTLGEEPMPTNASAKGKGEEQAPQILQLPPRHGSDRSAKRK